MAERERQESPLRYDSDETDTISLTDSVYSDYEGEEEKVWELEEIIAETPWEEEDEKGNVHDVTRYLLKWKGYSIYRSTWETESNLVEGAPDSLNKWKEKKMRVVRGFGEAFDVEKWEEEVEERQLQRIRRHERRNRRRRKLGKPLVEYPPEEGDDQSSLDEAASDIDMSSEDEPVRNIARRATRVESDEEQLHAPSRKKRRTADAMARDEEHRNELLRRKKSVAIPATKHKEPTKPAKSKAKETAKTIEVSKTTVRTPTAQVQAVSAASLPAARVGAVRVAPSTSTHFFTSASKAKKPPVGQQSATPAAQATRSDVTTAPVAPRADTVTQKTQAAPMARMVGGPSRIVQKARVPVLRTATASNLTANIFADIHKPVQRRKRAPAEGVYRNLQHLNNAQKAARREAAPSLADIQLFDPSTGKAVVRSPAKAKSTPAPTVQDSPSRRQSAVSDTFSASSDVTSESINEAIRQARSANNARSLPSTDQRSTGSAVSRSISPTAHQSISRSVLHDSPNPSPAKCCSFYANNFCRYGDRCPWPHNHDLPPMTSAEAKNAVTCYHWKSSTCRFPDTCPYTHAARSLISSPILRDPPTPMNPEPSPQRGFTCWYWLNSKCTKPVNACRFAHELREFIAQQPGVEPVRTASVMNLGKPLLSVHTAFTENQGSGGGVHSTVGVSGKVSSPILAEFVSAAPASDMLPSNLSPELRSKSLPSVPERSTTASTIRTPLSTLAPRSHRASATGHNPGNAAAALLGLSSERLFCWPKAPEKERIYKAVFLMYHANYAAEMKVVEAILHSLGSTVYHSTDDGAWTIFHNRYTSGVVIIHANFICFPQIPDFHKLIMKRFNLFQFLYQPRHLAPILPSHTPTDPSLLLTRIFPHGRAYFFSDYCFLNAAQDTLVAVKKLHARIKDARLNSYRLLGRPDLLNWLYDLASADIEKQAESLFIPPDPTRAEIWTILQKLLIEDEPTPENIIERLEQPGVPDPSDDSPVYFLRSADMPEHAEWARTDPMKAERLLSEWFAFWALEHRSDYRRFIMVGPAQVAEEWTRKFQHVHVRTPQQLLVDLDKVGG